MFTPESSEAALPMMFLLWLFWGSWPLCRKQGQTGNAEFGITYVVTQVFVTMVLCFSMGMMRFEGKRHFDERSFPEVLREEVQERFGAILLSAFAGAVLCAGDFIMACAIDVFGVVVACPIGFGIALTAGTTMNYVIEPEADPRLLFPGVLACLLGMLCDAASHALPDANEYGKTSSNGSSNGTDESSHKWYHWFLPLSGGVCCASFGPISTAAATFGELDPYAVYFFFMIGQLLMVLPMISIYTMAVEASARSWRAPLLVLQRYADVSRKSPKGLYWNCMAGVATGGGYFLYFIGSPVVSRAVGFIFGTSGLLLSIFAGIFVFKEYTHASRRKKALVAGATFFLVSALGLMCVAGRD